MNLPRSLYLACLFLFLLPSSFASSSPAATPTLSVAAGSYQNPPTVTISDTTAGAVVYYTVTGVAPTTLSTQYSGPLVVNRSMTLRAVAAVPGGAVSGIATAAYTILPAATPTLSVAAGSYQSPQTVTISDSTPGAAIYYTVTGVTPTTLSTKYAGPITVSSSMTLRAIAAVPNGPVSPIASATYTIVPAAAPTFSVAAGTYQVFKSVTISDATTNAAIYYTVTGVTPTTMSTKYSGPVSVNSNMTLKAIAAVVGAPVSPVASAAYNFVPAVVPTFSVAAGSYQSPQTVTISDATPGATIYYTVTGVAPTTLSTKYTGPIAVKSNMTLSAIAAIPGGPVSAATSAAYTIVPAGRPAFGEPAGTYQGTQSVSITDATPGASIYYTVTGVTPTTMFDSLCGACHGGQQHDSSGDCGGSRRSGEPGRIRGVHHCPHVNTDQTTQHVINLFWNEHCLSPQWHSLARFVHRNNQALGHGNEMGKSEPGAEHVSVGQSGRADQHGSSEQLRDSLHFWRGSAVGASN